jgi:hypothetical protein
VIELAPLQHPVVGQLRGIQIVGDRHGEIAVDVRVDPEQGVLHTDDPGSWAASCATAHAGERWSGSSEASTGSAFAALAHLRLARHRPPGKPNVAVFSPTVDEHGFASPHTSVRS